METFLEREKKNKERCNRLGLTYTFPTYVQFSVETYDDLNEENKRKFDWLCNMPDRDDRSVSGGSIRKNPYTPEILMSYIRKYDTSVLDSFIDAEIDFKKMT
jgi:hypothetical protein